MRGRSAARTLTCSATSRARQRPLTSSKTGDRQKHGAKFRTGEHEKEESVRGKPILPTSSALLRGLFDVGPLHPAGDYCARCAFVVVVYGLTQVLERGCHFELGQETFLSAQDLGMWRGQHVRRNQEFLMEFLTRAQTGNLDLDVTLRVFLVPDGEARPFDHLARQLVDRHRLAHIKHKDVSAPGK